MTELRTRKLAQDKGREKEREREGENKKEKVKDKEKNEGGVKGNRFLLFGDV